MIQHALSGSCVGSMRCSAVNVLTSVFHEMLVLAGLHVRIGVDLARLSLETAVVLQVQPGRDAHDALPAACAGDAALLQEGGRPAARQGEGPHPPLAVVPGVPAPGTGTCIHGTALACGCSLYGTASERLKALQDRRLGCCQSRHSPDQ